ncbi:hypothetical protein A4X09_0g7109 [Tilletia walkeri]|uniref:Uncharacterized protein n=1 Tax=Tilletia walkeri TaxID=117179 RepID=A0A8X7N2S0_9BASI|nr:hypothetical protein A4X09_0g7109 [Tilletia walkeri]
MHNLPTAEEPRGHGQAPQLLRLRSSSLSSLPFEVDKAGNATARTTPTVLLHQQKQLNGTVFNFCAMRLKAHCTFAVTPTADKICKEVGSLALNKLELEAERVATIISRRAAEPPQDDKLPDLRELRNFVWNRLLSTAVNAEADQQFRALVGVLQEQTAANTTQASGRKDLA